jgi:hypothetical protein
MRRRRIKIEVGPLCGFSDPGQHKIWIDPADHATQRGLMGTGGHEVFHLHHPEATETQAKAFEEDLCRVLYDRLGFRRPKRKKS